MQLPTAIGDRLRALLPSAAEKTAHRRYIASIGHLLGGNVAASLLAIIAVAATARALGTTSYGQLVMIYSFMQVVERVVSFQSWQPIIKYGAKSWDTRGHEDIAVLLKLGFAMDVGAAITAFLVALIASVVARYLFGWSDLIFLITLGYSAVLLFNISGTPTAILRLSGRFRTIAYYRLIALLVRVVACFAGLFGGAGLIYFALVWAGTQVLAALIMLAVALRELRRNEVKGVLAAPLAGSTSRFPGIWGFAWSANLSLTLRTSANRLDTLIVGALADPASAGLYHIAKSIGRIGEQLGAHVQAVLYPEVARLWTQGETARFRKLITQFEIVVPVVGFLSCILLALIIGPLLRLTAGEHFGAAAPLAVLQMVAVVLMVSGSAMRAGLFSMGRPHDVFRVAVVGTATFHLTALALIPQVGAIGGNIAHLVLGVVWIGGLYYFLHSALSSTAAGEATPAPAGPDVQAPSLCSR